MPANRFRTTNLGVRTPANRFQTPANRFRPPANRFRTPANRFGTPANRFGTTNLCVGPQTFVSDHKPFFRTTNLFGLR